jgi:cell division protein FtsA
MIDPQSTSDMIFALDIGTRTVIGIVGCMEGKNFKILAQELAEHEGRSMFDGQIHDIPRVAEVVAQIKAGLEKKTGLALDKVAVAAAGRSLKTIRCHAEMEHDENREIDQMDIRSLELSALRQAHRKLEGENAADYYCVGYCVITYTLGDMPVTNLLGHRAGKIGAEIVATFLPVSVVNSLYSVLHRVNLEPVHLTLEPIAAIDVAIPPSFRMLNLALVDIGAGTSDIAITRDGSIVAYGMVPMAGDEITEPIMEQLLVEFNEAEKIKKALGTGEQISYTDILGITNCITREQALEIINPPVDKLAGAISASILDLNGGIPPKSVFCIGGGAQTPGLTKKLAEHLQLDQQRVVIRDRSFLRNFVFEGDDFLSGPEGVTAVGIATVALTRLGYEFMTVRVNGSEYKIFNTRNINVSQVLGLVKFDPRHLICKNGRDLRFTLNKKEHTVFGELGRPARIYVGNREANLQTPVRDGDDILVIKAVDGADATARVEDFLPEKRTLDLLINGIEITWPVRALLNGTEAGPAAPVKPGDSLEIVNQPTIGEILKWRGINTTRGEIYINGQKATTRDTVADGDVIEVHAAEKIVNNGQPPGIKVTVNGEEIIIPQREAIFVDIFNHVKINTSDSGGTMVMRLNGARARYTDPIHHGDRIDLYWESSVSDPKPAGGSG